jgi:hypothetical protein
VTHDWNAVRDARAVLEVAPDPLDAAATYFARYPKHPPDFFTDRRRAAARRAFDDGEGWAARLLSCLETPAHFSLHAEHLGLDPSAAAPHLLFDRANVRRWKAAILRHFRGPCRWRLELGNDGRIHAHVLADLADGPPELPRAGEIVKPCAAYWTAAVSYQLKPALEYTPEHLAIWLEAKKRGRLPRLAGSHGIPQKRTWGNPSALRVYFAKPPTETTSTAAAETQPPPRPLDQLDALPPFRTPLKKDVGELASRPPTNLGCEVGHRARARAPPRPPRRRPHHRRYNPTSSPPTRTEKKVNDYRTEKLLELDQLTAALSPELEDVRRARRIARRLRSPRLTPLGARRALFDARAVSTRLRRVHDLGKEKAL